MAAADELTWDDTTGGVRRPSLADLGGADLEDDTSYPPATDGSELYALMCNQWTKQIAALGRVCPACVMTIAFSAGAPYIDKLASASANLVIGDFTLTDNGSGDTTIAWAANKLPAMSTDPVATPNAIGGDTTAQVSVVSATSIRVQTYAGGVIADTRVTVTIY